MLITHSNKTVNKATFMYHDNIIISMSIQFYKYHDPYTIIECVSLFS